MAAEDFDCIQRLPTPADDIADVIVDTQIIRWLIKMTPSTLIDVTRRISCNMGGAVNCGLRLQSVKTISTDLALLSFKLLACAQSAT